MSLPPLVERHLERALPDGPGDATGMRLTQEGSMWMRPRARPIRFSATEYFATERVAFTWRARFRLLRIPLDVVDAYDKGQGLLEFRFAGVRLRRQRGRELALGESLRYLAELPWVPQAISLNRELEWREAGEHAVEVSTLVGDERATVTLEFDHAGDIVRAAAVRKRPVGKSWEETPWGGEFGDYTAMGRIRLPAAAEAYWDLGGGERYVYWRGRVLTASPE